MKFRTTFLTICAVIFGLTTMAIAAVKPVLASQATNGDNRFSYHPLVKSFGSFGNSSPKLSGRSFKAQQQQN